MNDYKGEDIMNNFIDFIKFSDDPSGNIYIGLIDLLFDIGDYFYLVTRKELDKSRTIDRLFDQLDEYKIAEREQRAWGGTKLDKMALPATIHYFKVCDETKHKFIEYSDSLFKWVSPLLPEDPTFIRDKKYVLITTTHESTGYLNCDMDFIRERVRTIYGLNYEICKVRNIQQFIQEDCSI